MLKLKKMTKKIAGMTNNGLGKASMIHPDPIQIFFTVDFFWRYAEVKQRR